MTNLSPDLPRWQRWLSRERLLMGAPVLGAVVAVLLLAGLDGWPRYGRLQEQQQRLEELRQKQALLPGLRRQLVLAQARADEVAQQQALLVNLIAGRECIQTFLAQISREAGTSGVVIELYEPALPTPSPTKNSRNRSRSTKAKDSGKDPLSNLGYSKTSVLLQAKGSYQGLLTFLRRMESLQLLVQPSDLALKALESKSTKENALDFSTPLTQLKLRLSFFDPVKEKSTKKAQR